MNTKPLAMLVVSIAIPLLVGVIGGLITSPAITDWYDSLEKPSFSPPNWIFAPVWTSLYVLMGIASFLIWRELNKRTDAKSALLVYGVQLLLNLMWSVLFFGLKNPGIAVIEIVILFALIVLMIRLFWNVSKPAAVLLMPYLIWVTFAGVLNYEIWQLNR